MYKSLYIYIYIYIYINGCIIEVSTKIFIMKLEVFINEHHEKLLSLGHEFYKNENLRGTFRLHSLYCFNKVNDVLIPKFICTNFIKKIT